VVFARQRAKRRPCVAASHEDMRYAFSRIACARRHCDDDFINTIHIPFGTIYLTLHHNVCLQVRGYLSGVPLVQSPPTGRWSSKSVATNAKPMTVTSAAAASDIGVKEEKMSETSVKLVVTVPSKLCTAAYKSTLEEWNQKVTCDGYRKGKAPETILIDQLGGKKRVYATVLANLIESVMGPALEKCPSSESAIADSEKIFESGEELENRFNPSQDLTFSVTFDVMPELKWTKPYNSLSVTVTEVTNEANNAAIVEQKMRQLSKEGAQMKVVAGRGVEKGDVVIIDFDASIDGEQIPGAMRQGMQLDTDTADEDFLPGVAEALKGMITGEEKETQVTFPTSEDFSPAALRGKVADIKVKLSEVFEYELPQLTDEWAVSKLGPGSTIADVRKRLEENTVAEQEEKLDSIIADKFTDAVADCVDVNLPISLIQEAGQNQYSSELNSLISKGTISYEQAQQLASPQMLEQYIKNKKDELEHLQKAALGFADILSKEKIAPSAQEIEEEFERAMEGVRQIQRQGEVNEDGVREQVVQSMETQAVMEWLKANCTVERLPFEG
jgi:trigger factor